MQETESLAAVNMLRAAINHKHEVAGLPSPSMDKRVSGIFRAFNRLHGGPREPVDPMPYEAVKKMITGLRQPIYGRDSLKAPLTLWRTVWRAVISFFTLSRFTRSSETRIDLRFNERRIISTKPRAISRRRFPSTNIDISNMVREYFGDDWATLPADDLAKRRSKLAVIIEATDREKEKSLKSVIFYTFFY
jgi:hypothetical protein